MVSFYRLKNFSLMMLLGCFILSCSQLGIQSKKDTPEPSSLPECEKNYEKEGIWPFGRVYKTWVKYSPLDYGKGFDSAVMAVKTSGYKTISADRDSGTIKAEMISQKEDLKTYPVEIKLVKEESSVIVYLRSSSSSDETGKACFCNFYHQFEKSMKRSQSAQAGKQPSPPPKKSAEPGKGSSPPSPSPVAENPRASSAALTPPPDILPQTEVEWKLVNLREGPGMKYKVVGKVTKGTSLTVLEEKTGWCHVRLESGTEAWIIKTATSAGAKGGPASGPSPSPASSKTRSSGAQPAAPRSPM